VRHEREYWRRRILAHRQTDLTQTEYCLLHGLHPKTYRSWHHRLEAEGSLVSSVTGESGARVAEGVEDFASPLLQPGGTNTDGSVGMVGSVVRRQQYTDEEKQQFVVAALQSGLPIERYARMSGLTPSALHRWKHKFAIYMGILPAVPIKPQPAFASVAIAPPAERTSPEPDPMTSMLKASVWNSVDVVLSSGRRLTVDVRVDGLALRRLLAILEAPL
jgi:transposase